MKKIGIIGGLGPESTIDYYKGIISGLQKYNTKDYPEIIIESVNMNKVLNYLELENYEEIIDYLSKANTNLAKSNASFSVIASNTPHIVFDEVNNLSSIPMISIVEETFKKVKNDNLQIIGLIGTKFTMEKDFYKKKFINEDIKIVVPDQNQQEYINKTILEEVEYGIVKEETKKNYLNIINKMKEKENIKGLILGCTELHLILNYQDDKDIKFYNTTEIHIESIIDYVLF